MRFSQHARKRLILRGIEEADVDAVLREPTRIERIRPNATSFYGRALDGRAIVVSVADQPDDLIITVMLDESQEQQA